MKLSDVPVTPSIDPRENAPAAALGFVALFAAVHKAATGWDAWQVIVLFVVIAGLGIFVQNFTTRHKGD